MDFQVVTPPPRTRTTHVEQLPKKQKEQIHKALLEGWVQFENESIHETHAKAVLGASRLKTILRGNGLIEKNSDVRQRIWQDENGWNLALMYKAPAS